MRDDLQIWRNKVKKYYDHLALNWNCVGFPVIPNLLELKSYTDIIKQHKELKLKSISKELEILILGVTPQLRSIGTNFGNVTAVDFSEIMIEKTKNSNLKKKYSETLILDEWHNYLKMAEKKFHIILSDASFNLMQGPKDLQILFDGAKKVLFNNGLIVSRVVLYNLTEKYMKKLSLKDMIEKTKLNPSRKIINTLRYAHSNAQIRNPNTGITDYGAYNAKIENLIRRGIIDSNFAKDLKLGILQIGDTELWVPDKKIFLNIIREKGFLIAEQIFTNYDSIITIFGLINR